MIQWAPRCSRPRRTWITVAEANRTINPLDLQSGNTTVLGETDIDAGTVGAVRDVINTALSSVVDVQNQPVTVQWGLVGEQTLYAYVQASLALFTPDAPHDLIIDFDVGRSFEDVTGDGSLYFMPWIRALDGAGVGALEGVVRGPADDSAS